MAGFRKFRTATSACSKRSRWEAQSGPSKDPKNSACTPSANSSEAENSWSMPCGPSKREWALIPSGWPRPQLWRNCNQ